MPPMRACGGRRWRRGLSAACLLLLAPRPASPAPDAFLPVGGPLEAELRLLDLTDPIPAQRRLLLPHLHTRPLQWRELEGEGAPPESLGPARAISFARLERGLGRNALPGFAPHPVQRSTPF